MKQKFALMLIMIMTVTALFSSVSYAAADNKVGIEIKFDKDEYVKGETATAVLSLTDLSDEKDAGITLGAFETHLKFDNEKLTYNSEESGFDANLFKSVSESEQSKITQEFQVTTNYSDIIVVAFEYNNGISLENVDKNGRLVIGKASFTIQDSVPLNYGIEIGFEESETTYITEVVLPTLKDRLKCTVPTEESKATIKNVIVENQSAAFDNGIVKGSIDVRLSTGQNAVLIAQLFDMQTGLTKGTVVEPNLSGVNKITDISFNNIAKKDNLVVRYFLWESFNNMKALTTIKSSTVQ